MSLLLSEEDARKRLEHPDNVANIATEKHVVIRGQGLEGGNKNGKRLDPMLQELVGVVANLDGAAEAGRQFGVSSRHAQNLRDGSTDGKTVNKELKAKIEDRVGEIRDKALEKTLAAMGLLTDDKLSGVKARDLASIAKDMAGVFEKLSEKEVAAPNAVITVYAPQVTKIDDFKVVEVVTKRTEE